MADPVSYRPSPGEIPTNPGVYRFRDEHRRVIYVGKAKNLRSRLNSYFASPQGLMPKTRAMVFTAAAVEWTVVSNELEALQLEFTWIKEFNPRFNIAFRDDKSYPYLAVTMGEKFPRVQVMRGDRQRGTRYFGPYSQVWAIRETVDTLLRVFPVRTCSNGVFKRAQASGRPCLLGYIDKCSAPCVGRISPEDHQALAAEFCAFMSGQAKQFISSLEKQMAAAVAELDYERAATLRDDLAALRKVFERNAVVLSEDTDADVFALSGDELEAAVQVFHVRGGRIRGQRGWVVEKVEEASDADLIEHLIQQVYGEATTASNKIPRQILVPDLPANTPEVEQWLQGLRGSKVAVQVPRRGDKASLLRTVHENAEQALRLHKSRRAGDLTTRSAALQELQEALEVPLPLMRIECFDISHVSGTNVVASMVVVEDGLPKKSDYRKFSITGDAARDDTAAMYDVVSRRFRNYLWERETIAEAAAAATGTDGEPGGAARPAIRMDTTTEAPKARFAYPPNLVVVDGGQPQVAAAAKALEDLGIDDVYVIGLAKRLEEVWVPHSDFPVILPRASQALFLLQRVRDEAHRFAITFHRQKRGKSMTASALDTISGLGPAKRKALLKHFGSVKKIKQADIEQLQEAPGIGPALAETIHQQLGAAATAELLDQPPEAGEASTGGADDARTDEPAAVVNMTTGEILDT